MRIRPAVFGISVPVPPPSLPAVTLPHTSPFACGLKALVVFHSLLSVTAPSPEGPNTTDLEGIRQCQHPVLAKFVAWLYMRRVRDRNLRECTFHRKVLAVSEVKQVNPSCQINIRQR